MCWQSELLNTMEKNSKVQALQDRKIRDLEIMLEGSKTNVKSTQDMYRQQVSSFNAEMDELHRQLVRPCGHPGVLACGCDVLRCSMSQRALKAAAESNPEILVFSGT
jgi:hypothetical protein